MIKTKEATSRIESLREKAKRNPRRIVLPEGGDERVIEAACLLAREGLAKVILLGKRKDIETLIKRKPDPLSNLEIVEPESHPKLGEITTAFYELRKHKGISPKEAREYILKDHVYFAGLMTRLGMADGFVAGASHTTSNVARAAIHCLGIDREIGVVSSSFIIELENCPFGENGLFIFGDCGIVPEPDASQLAGIAISSSLLMKCLFGIEPRTALLSYSTKGSAKGPSVDKVLGALRIIKERKRDLLVDGELQIDAAIVPEVAKIKSPESPVAGKANVLIFPNLDAGNISYKLIQRLGKARVVGPILQGLVSPASDLSRGCGVEEIVDAVCVTAVKAQSV